MGNAKYKLLFKINPSKNVYYVSYRKHISDKFEKIAVVEVKPGFWYSIKALKKIEYAELLYLENYFRKIARISNETTITSIS